MRTLPIYADYHSTTPVDPRVIEVMVKTLQNDFGNPQSTDHVFGDRASETIDEAAGEIRHLLSAVHHEVCFTAGASSALNATLRALAERHLSATGEPLRVVLSAVEHSALLHVADALRVRGQATATLVEVDDRGRLDLDHLTDLCRKGADVVCIMYANNEIGNIYPIRQSSQIAHDHGAILVSDATQAVGKVPISMEEDGIDILICSAHKFYGPKGVGAIVVDQELPTEGLVNRGTPNVAGIAGMGEAARLRGAEREGDEGRIAKHRDRLQHILSSSVDGLIVNGDRVARLAGNLHFSVPGVPNKAVVARLRERVALSTGSACRSGIEQPSHVLSAMGLPQEHAEGSFRIGLGKFTSTKDVDCIGAEVASAISATRSTMVAVG